MTRHRRAISILAAALATLGGAACGGSSPVAPTTVSHATLNWSTSVAPHGASSRFLTVTTAGTISVTLLNIALPPTTPIGLGVGLARGSTSCDLSASVNATAGAAPQLTINVDPGTYCVSVYDLGTLTDVVGFVVSIEHP